MSSDRLAISASGVCKRYGIYARPVDRLKELTLGPLRRTLRLEPARYSTDFWALRPTSLEISRGETVGIIGRNGSGKSTLLQLICGTLTPTSGTVRKNGRIAALLELGAGFNGEFTGEENIRLSALLYGISEEALSQRFASIVEFSELGDFIGQPVRTYSSGMYVRLAFSIAAHVDADILVIDEALSVGDVRFAQKCARFLRDFQTRGTLLFVSHDLSAVINLCTRAIWLDRGNLVVDGPSKEVVEAYLAEQHAQDRLTAGAHVQVSRPADAQLRRPASSPDGSTEESFEFDPDRSSSAFGERKIRIEQVELKSEDGRERAILGGRIVELAIHATAVENVENVIFGFYVKDRLGQRLFGDNSYLAYFSSPPKASAGSALVGRFRFRMPMMPAGEYTVDVAVATGTQLEHTQQHWIHDAVTFHSGDQTMRSGLVGIPMLDITVS
jgi:lipopolysaccharide transport system ATP-binding protein